MNSWVGIGNLTADPEMRYTDSGTPVTSFSIAINNGRDQEGNERPPTYVDIVAWDKLAERTAEYLRKGNKAAVQGAITVEKWEDKDSGKTMRRWRIRAFSVEFLTPRSENEDRPSRRDDDDRRPAPQRSRSAPRDDLEGLPF